MEHDRLDRRRQDDHEQRPQGRAEVADLELGVEHRAEEDRCDQHRRSEPAQGVDTTERSRLGELQRSTLGCGPSGFAWCRFDVDLGATQSIGCPISPAHRSRFVRCDIVAPL